MQVVILRCETALQSPDPSVEVRAAVRDGFVALRETPSDDAFALLRAIEFEADRIELFGTSGVKAQLAYARAVLKITDP